ncbi:MAG: helix-turn-helix transcriptional regulator [Eubacteriales bacterium]|nr:helix-turn-helix transcriptional regulator [Eubacteriales bacterium]
MSDQSLAERIKLSREKIGITKTESARRLKLSKIGYCRYEYGQRTPSIQTLEAIASCFETSVDYLTGVTDDSSANAITIRKADSPKMFEFVVDIHNSSEETLNRLLTYYNAIKDSEA